MSAVPHHDPLAHHCRVMAGDLVDVSRATARARALSAQGRGAERSARDAVSELLLLPPRPRAHCHRLLELWQPLVVRWCRAGAGRGVSAEDAAHDALIRLFERLDDVRDPARFHGFVWGLTWRVLREHERVPAVVRWVRSVGDERAAPSLVDQVERADHLHAIHTVLRKLSLDDRELLWLAYAEGMRRADLAAHLGLAEGTLNRRLTRARARFETLARRAGVAPLGAP